MTGPIVVNKCSSTTLHRIVVAGYGSKKSYLNLVRLHNPEMQNLNEISVFCPFLSAWLKLCLSGKREPQLRNYLRHIGHWGIFLINHLMWEGLSHHGWCHPWVAPELYKMWGKRTMRCKPVSNILPLSLLQFPTSGSYPELLSSLAPLKDGLWLEHAKQINPFFTKLFLVLVFINSNGK